MYFKNIFTILTTIVLFQLSINSSIAQKNNSAIQPSFLNDSTHWVDSVFNSLSFEERIAQLIMVAGFSNKDLKQTEELTALVHNYNIGGVIFFQGGPQRQAAITNLIQSSARTPLLIGIDGEWGLAMRLDSTLCYPKQMMLGAISDDSLIYQMGVDIARQCKRLGIQINFAPVIDINNNPKNPVINMRSFGEDKMNVSRKGLSYMKGLQDNRILSSAKHFPGHGDTDADSHLTLPVINQTAHELDTMELFPFRELIFKGLSGIMVAHLFIPRLDSTPNRPSSLSPIIVNDLLKTKLHFNGLVYTDALTMKGFSTYGKNKDLIIQAFLAGNDVLLMPDNIPNVIDDLCEAVHDSIISKEEINKRCYKIIQAKYWTGLNKSVFVTKDHLYEDLHSPELILQQQKLYESSITLLKNENEIIPVKNLEKLKIASLVIGYKDKGEFQKTMDLYADMTHFYIDRASTYFQFDSIAKLLKNYNLIIAGIVNTDIRVNKNFGINDSCFYLFDSLARKKTVILDMFTNPYALAKIKNPELYKAIILSYEDKDIIQNLSAQLIFGGIPAKGLLPVTASEQFCLGNGIIQKSSVRLKYAIPEETGIASSSLNCIDSVVSDAIAKHVFPGCQILIAKEGKVIYWKSFGHHTYDRVQPVKNSDIYDLASITKITATTAAIMKLSEQNKIKLNKSLSSVLPGSSRSDKGKLIISDLLQHQSGLVSFIPFYMSTITPANNDENLMNKSSSDIFTIKSLDNYYFNKSIKYIEGYYSHAPYNYFTTQVADSLYILKTYTDSIIRKIYASPLQFKKKQVPAYKYSDLGFILLGKAVEKITKQTLDQYVDSVFYKPLGATTLGYLPLKKFEKDRIMPTENDLIFRKQVIQGYVHDPTCAMMGGVSGHAGLFSNANDLAKMMQLFLNKGTYGGTRFLDTATVDNFTSRQTKFADNRRGLGFDKPETDTTKKSPASSFAPPSSYGHSGFTGTFTWVDPDNQLIYIFLSNRVYPDQSNNKLVEMNVRTNIQDIIYKAMNCH